MTDTVGFVRNLPHRLVEAFKATLEEAVISDFLIHVLDASAPEIFEFHETTLSVLRELGAADKPMITVLNKVDLITDDLDRLHELKSHFDERSVFISAVTGAGLDKLTGRLCEMMVDRVTRLTLRIPQARQDLVALLHREAKILTTEYDGNDVILTAIVSRTIRHKVDEFAIVAAS